MRPRRVSHNSKMVEGAFFSSTDNASVREMTAENQAELVELWTQVGQRLDRSQKGRLLPNKRVCDTRQETNCSRHFLTSPFFVIVVWKSTIESLENLLHFLSICPEVLSFVEHYAQVAFEVLYAPSTIGLLNEDRIIVIAQFLLEFFLHLSDNTLQRISPKLLRLTLRSLRRMMDQLITSRRAAVMQFYAAWRSFSFTLISSPSLPLQLAGWEQVNELIQAGADHRPPPRQYVVSGAGNALVNGIYDYAGPVTPNGYSPLGAEVSYVRIIPNDVPEFGGRPLTLFRCNIESGERWWFLSKVDTESPGTEADVDYYRYEDDPQVPPSSGWTIPTRSDGVAPPPSLQPVGALVPPGQERATLEHQLAAWAMEHALAEQLIRNPTLHPDVVAQSTGLIQFLFDRHTRDADFTVSGLIPTLCEAGRTRRAMNTECIIGRKSPLQGVTHHLNESEAPEAKKQIAARGKCSLNSLCEGVAMEMSMGGSKQTKVEMKAHQCHGGAQGRAELRSSIEKLLFLKWQLMREYRTAVDRFIKDEAKSGILTINKQLANAEHDLNKLLEECEKYKAGMDSASAPDESGASNVRGHSGDTTFSNNEIKTGDGKDCAIDSDSNVSSDGSHSIAEEQA
jgi:hypothetical protein